MIDKNTLLSAIQSFIVTAATFPDSNVIFAYQNAPRPSNPYISLNITNVTILSSRKGTPDNAGSADYVSDVELTLSAEVISSNALGIASAIYEASKDPNNYDVLSSSGIYIIDNLFIGDVTTLFETKWEERAQLDLLVRVASVKSNDVGFISTVNATGNMYNADGSLAYNGSFQVT